MTGMELPAIASGRRPDGRFGPGNPGRRKGSRHRVSTAVEELLEGEAEKLTRAAIEAALNGDPAALRLCIERIAPARRGKLVRLSRFPVIRRAEDVPAALASILRAVGAGELTAEEGSAIAAIAERFLRAVETADLATRITALEAAK